MNYTFYGLRQLAQLHLESNNIRRLEGHEFLSLRGNDRSSAQRYDHRNNIITAKHGSLTHLVREPMAPPETRSVCLLIVIMRLFSGLRELYLHRNLIDYIEFETFGHLESLEVLTLAHTPPVPLPRPLLPGQQPLPGGAQPRQQPLELRLRPRHPVQVRDGPNH